MMEPLRLEPLFPDRSTGEPLAAQLARRLRDAVESGTLPPGTKMLGSRQLAQHLGIARNTVTLAFEQLVAEGYLTSRSGSGTFVTVSPFERARRPATTQSPKSERARFAALRSRFDTATGRGALRPGMPALESFPHAAWTRCARRALNAYAGDLGYGHASGLDSLREAIATHVRQFRGVSALSEQVVVVEGAQAAFHLASVVLARPGDCIAIEDPCYALARAAFELYGLQPHAVA
ncbi:MAG TPA: PLP-dependent aminotransferase family protein, partial [Candidatus Baltobacteraceae bacterium]|nr:PLP-dependent aminotransferase family protein [Candidatus Baltobacteraceae bacterium]